MNVFRYFGVNDKILMNEATGDEWSSFYEGEIETFGVQFSQVVTDMLWSDLERSYGAGITLAADTVQFMSALDELGTPYQSTEYYNTTNKSYQIQFTFELFDYK